MRGFFFFLAVFFLFSGCVRGTLVTVHMQSGEDVLVVARVASTALERKQGLQHTKQLQEHEGMLFLFPEPAKLSFWMKDVSYPLDMIFFDQNRSIVHIVESAPPCTEVTYSQQSCALYGPSDLAQYVLEVRAGFVNEHFISLGDTLSW